MARARQFRWMCCGTWTAALLMGLCAVEAQEGEPAPYESVPQRGARGRRSAAGQARPAGDAERAAAADDRDQVDTSRNLREVYRANYAPAHALAATLEKHFRGVPGLSLIAETAGNSLLISAPPERFKELIDTIRKLDRAPKSAAVEVTILDFLVVNASKEISAQEFFGSSEKVRAKVNELKKSGHIQRVRRFRLTALDNQVTNLQANGDRPAGGPAPMAGGFPAGFQQGGGRGNAARFPSVGTTVHCTARISADKGVVMDLSVHDAPANRDAQQMPEGVASQFLGTLSIPSATTVIASEIATETENGPSRIVILVSADVIEPPPEKPLAGGPR